MKTEAGKPGFDFIGDIHGHANELKALLDKLGYSIQDGFYRHPTRKLFFVGDYIDRGPKIRETLAIVKGMVDNNQAIALMGNHEYNAICYHTESKTGGYLRKHSELHLMQHHQTLEQFKDHQQEFKAYLEWFKTLPLFYETEEFRAVHACWDDANISYLRSVLDNGRLTDDLIHASNQKGTQLYYAIEETLKGKEMTLPNGLHFHDKEGTKRTAFRIRWWEDPAASTYKNISVLALDQLSDTAIDMAELRNASFYSPVDKPVFFGHYWLNGEPALYKKNICCLDYSVAKKGKLVAYRFDNEKELDDLKLIYIQ